MKGIDARDVLAVAAHRAHVALPRARQSDGSAKGGADDHDPNQSCEDDVAPRPPRAIPGGKEAGYEADQQILRADADCQRQQERPKQIRLGAPTAAQQTRRGDHREHDRGNVAEGSSSEVEDVGEERTEQRGHHGGLESKPQLATEEEDCRKESHPRHEAHGLESAEVARRHQPEDVGEADEDGKPRRVRVGFGDVEPAHGEREKRLVPLPQRTGHGEEARRRADNRQHDHDRPLLPRQTLRRLGEVQGQTGRRIS